MDSWFSSSIRSSYGWVPASLRRSRSTLALCAVLLAACGQQSPAPESTLSTQATYTVTTLTGSGPGSLRAAMEAANASPEDDVITFGALGDKTIRLGGAISRSLTAGS